MLSALPAGHVVGLFGRITSVHLLCSPLESMYARRSLFVQYNLPSACSFILTAAFARQSFVLYVSSALMLFFQGEANSHYDKGIIYTPLNVLPAITYDMCCSCFFVLQCRAFLLCIPGWCAMTFTGVRRLESGTNSVATHTKAGVHLRSIHSSIHNTRLY